MVLVCFVPRQTSIIPALTTAHTQNTASYVRRARTEESFVVVAVVVVDMKDVGGGHE